METDKVVMGARKDSLHDMVKYNGNEGAIVWPLWKNDLMERIRYELGQKAVQIVCVQKHNLQCWHISSLFRRAVAARVHTSTTRRHSVWRYTRT